jgi:parvulin-like peptidyl-prolyl isomerase
MRGGRVLPPRIVYGLEMLRLKKLNVLIGSLAVVLSVWTASRAQSAPPPPNVIARAGSLYITENEFLERFELLPGLQRSRASRIDESKLELVYSLIAEKLLAQEAGARRLDQDSVAGVAFDEVRRMLSRDELYREEIQRKVHVPEVEITKGMAEAQRELLIAFMFFQRKPDALAFRRLIKSEPDFDRLRLERKFRAAYDTATVIWGDADPAIERVAYGLNVGEVSEAAKAGTGYYILTIRRIRTNGFYASMQASVLRERVGQTLRLRKERKRMDEYLLSVLKTKTGYARPGPFTKLGRAVERAFLSGRVQGKTTLSEEMIRNVRRDCASVLQDTLAVAGPRIWTTENVIDQLSFKGFAVDGETVRSLPGLLNAQVRTLVQQELLAQEALKRKLDQRKDVSNQLQVWHENILAQRMKSEIRKHASVTDAEVWSHLRSSDTSVIVPIVRIRELQTSTLDDMAKALEELDAGAGLEEVIMRWSSDPELRRRKGISEPFPVSMRPPLGELAGQMNVGQRMGPLKDSTRYVYFELLSRDSTIREVDTSARGRFARAKSELLLQKEKRLVTLFLAQSGADRGFDVYEDRLQRLKVSTVPMMTFKILGFGGRMFAVPFVEPQLQWLNVEPGNNRIAF